MKKNFQWCYAVLCLMVLLAACVPYSFSPPTQIHINPSDHVTEPVIAVDATGRSHIAGVVNGRIVYTRTTFGDLKTKLTMTMEGSGTLWTQYSPDIAATDIGTAWLVWLEQRGDGNKIACYQAVLIVPPPGGNNTGCIRLDQSFFSVDNIMVIARGNKAYALYDAFDGSSGIGSFWYKELTHPSNSGMIYQYAGSESIYLLSWDAKIDTAGYLHVALLENFGTSVNRLRYRSNRTTEIDGTMTQNWLIGSSEGHESDAPISLSIFQDGTVETVAIASVFEVSGIDRIDIHTCTTAGCGSHDFQIVTLPSAWSTQSVITDVELVGIDTTLHLGFIGDSGATTDHQVYYMPSASSSNPPDILSEYRSTFKHDLEAVKVDPRPESPSPISFATFSWGERDIDSMEYYSFDGVKLSNVFNTDCLSSQVSGETASNGVYHSGVWKACGDTWFTTQANQVYLPVITK